jgi:DNA repair protein RadC
MLELVPFRAIPRRDVKPLAKALIARFGSFAEVIAAPPPRLREIDGLGEAAVAELKIAEAAARRLARGTLCSRKQLSSFSDVLDYCRTTMALAEREEFRRSTPGKSCDGRWNSPRLRSFSSTIIRRATPLPPPPISA